LKIILAAWLLGISRFVVILGLDSEMQGSEKASMILVRAVWVSERSRGLRCAPDDRKNLQKQRQGKSRSPSGMTTKETTTTAKAKYRGLSTARRTIRPSAASVEMTSPGVRERGWE
jgi:hypothetical protein